MSRKWPQDGDDARVAPNGSVRIAYDADTQTYTYRHPNGDLYEGAPGSEYGPLRLVSPRRQSTDMAAVNPTQPPAYLCPRSPPPPYSEPSTGAANTHRPQGSRRRPAATFDEILTRHPTDNNSLGRGSTEREMQSSVGADAIPRRSVSLRSFLGPRRHLSAAEERMDRPAHRTFSRRATMMER